MEIKQVVSTNKKMTKIIKLNEVKIEKMKTLIKSRQKPC